MDRFLFHQRIARAKLPPKTSKKIIDTWPPDAVSFDWDAPWLTRQQCARLKEALADGAEPPIADKALRLGIRTVVHDEPEYPDSLRPFEDAPPFLFVRGDVLPALPGVAIVGSRRPDSYGLEQANRFSRCFAENGFAIVSGGAAGIDAAAHRSALRAGAPTVAILGCGPEIAYPAAHRDLFNDISANGGAIVSEFPPGTRPEPWHFPARNRIIAGWAIVTVVIEAPEHSGALITARNAAEYGRDVLVVPGPVDTGRSRGGHRLIMDGATLIETPEEAVAIAFDRIGMERPDGRVPRAMREIPDDLGSDEILLFHAASESPIPLESLALQIGIGPDAATVAATLLELKGLLRREVGNRWGRQPGWSR